MAAASAGKLFRSYVGGKVGKLRLSVVLRGAGRPRPPAGSTRFEIRNIVAGVAIQAAIAPPACGLGPR